MVPVDEASRCVRASALQRCFGTHSFQGLDGLAPSRPSLFWAYGGIGFVLTPRHRRGRISFGPDTPESATVVSLPPGDEFRPTRSASPIDKAGGQWLTGR